MEQSLQRFMLNQIITVYLHLNLFYFYPESPVFRSTPRDSITVPSISASIRVNCSATGSPLPTITWYKNNVSMNVINNVTDGEVISEFVIKQFQPSDQATYTCVARNFYNDTVQSSSEIGKASICMS